MIHASSSQPLPLIFSTGDSRTHQAKDDLSEACLMIPDVVGGGRRITVFYYFPYTFPNLQQMVEDIIRAFHQFWDFAFCMHCKHF